ncbi:MAG: hypothetical protein AB7T49_02830 [Oligoflexales bacterium]
MKFLVTALFWSAASGAFGLDLATDLPGKAYFIEEDGCHFQLNFANDGEGTRINYCGEPTSQTARITWEVDSTYVVKILDGDTKSILVFREDLAAATMIQDAPVQERNTYELTLVTEPLE